MESRQILLWIRTLILILCSLTSVSAWALNGTQQSRFDQLFSMPRTPPPSFKQLAQAQTILVDVYYSGKLLSVEKARITPNSVQFVNPKMILLKINDLKNTDQILASLSGPLNPHADLVCNQYQHQGCNILSPDIAGIIYDPTAFRLYLFINPRYTNDDSDKTWLDNSTAGWSYVNHLFTAADSGTANPLTNSTNQLSNVALTNVTSDNILAYHNTRLDLSASYANQPNFGGFSNAKTVQLNAANVAYDHEAHEYTAGVIEVPGSIFFANHAILGAEVATTLNTLQHKDQYLSQPLNIFLPFASTVSILQGAKIIYSANLPAGNQKIDTTNFPPGSYPVTIRISSSEGGTIIQTQMVTNTTLLAPIGMPQYYGSLGYLMGIRQVNSNVYDELLPVPVYQGGVNYRLRQNMGLMVDVLGSDHSGFVNPGVAFLSHGITLEPGVLVTTNGQYGYTTALNWQRNQWGAHYNISQILNPGNNNTPPEDCTAGSPSSCALNLLNQTTFYTNLSLSYAIPFGSVNVYGSENKMAGSEEIYTYGSNVLINLHHSSAGVLQLNLNANRTQTSTQVLATLLFNFAKPHRSGSLGAGYGYFSNNYQTDTPSTQNGTGPTAQGNIIFDHVDDTNQGPVLGLQGNTNPILQNVGATFNETNKRFYLNTYGTDQFNTVGNYPQYGGTFDTRFAWAQNKETIGYNRPGDNAAIEVSVKADDPHATFDIYANDRIIGHLRANRTYLLKLDGYKTWRVHIEDTSKDLYSFTEPDKVVTLYPGNVQALLWRATRMIAVGGRVLDTQQMPITNAIVKGGAGFATTDEAGYLQINVPQYAQELQVETTREHCTIHLPALNASKPFVYIGTLTCQPSLQN